MLSVESLLSLYSLALCGLVSRPHGDPDCKVTHSGSCGQFYWRTRGLREWVKGIERRHFSPLVCCCILPRVWVSGASECVSVKVQWQKCFVWLTESINMDQILQWHLHWANLGEKKVMLDINSLFFVLTDIQILPKSWFPKLISSDTDICGGEINTLWLVCIILDIPHDVVSTHWAVLLAASATVTTLLNYNVASLPDAVWCHHALLLLFFRFTFCPEWLILLLHEIIMPPIANKNNLSMTL